MTRHHPELFAAWDDAMAELGEAAHQLRAAIKASAQDDAEPDVDDLVRRLSEKKRAAMTAWVAYTDASGFGRI